MPSDGSTAMASSPLATICRVSFPVPAARSSTRVAAGRSSQSRATPGYEGRPCSYALATAPKDVARLGPERFMVGAAAYRSTDRTDALPRAQS